MISRITDRADEVIERRESGADSVRQHQYPRKAVVTMAIPPTYPQTKRPAVVNRNVQNQIIGSPVTAGQPFELYVDVVAKCSPLHGTRKLKSLLYPKLPGAACGYTVRFH